jgi:hypothetical protein
MIEKSPLDEAFEELERKLKEQSEPSRHREIKSVDDAFSDWDHSHRPQEYDLELRAFRAGWIAGIRNEWAKERND